MIIKPDGVKKRLVGEILKKVESDDLTVKSLKMTQLDRRTARKFYAIHKERPFFHSLIEYMTSGPVVVAALEGMNSVVRYRELIGATNPKEAKPGTIRNLYGESIEYNIVHGSDSADNGLIETSFFFSSAELGMIDNGE